MAANEQLLAQQLRRLQLHYVLRHYPDAVAQAARESWTHARFLEHLVAGEAARRDEALVHRRVKAARLPGIKTLDGFDWSWPKQINRAQIQQLFRLDFLPQHGNVVLLGAVGVGKTHLAIALAHTACLQGHTALFASAVDIVNTRAAAQATGGIKRELARLATTDQARPSAQDQPAARAEEERRRQLLDQLAQIEKRINVENARPRRRYVSPSAREGVHAIYYDTLRSRIEDIGTRNFPEDKGVKLYGELSMLLEIDSLGRVVEAEIIQTSGNRLLDRKAQSIVRGAGPYGHFTPQMRAQFDRLVFVSRFRFTREQGLQATVEENQNAPQGR